MPIKTRIRSVATKHRMVQEANKDDDDSDSTSPIKKAKLKTVSNDVQKLIEQCMEHHPQSMVMNYLWKMENQMQLNSKKWKWHKHHNKNRCCRQPQQHNEKQALCYLYHENTACFLIAFLWLNMNWGKMFLPKSNLSYGTHFSNLQSSIPNQVMQTLSLDCVSMIVILHSWYTRRLGKN